MDSCEQTSSLQILASKGRRRLVMLTAYDYTSALLVDAAGVDMMLVGDSLGMTMLGYGDTLPVTMDQMVHHCRAVSAARPSALLVCDMPFLSYETGPRDALRNAGRLMAEGGARAVKLEGGVAVVPQIRALVEAGIPVMGHVGLTPQRVATLGGFRVQGKSAAAAKHIMEDLLAVQEAGCFAVVLECVPREIAAVATRELRIPTIGIGAGAACDGQVLVFHDLLGLNQRHVPKFVKQYATLGNVLVDAVQRWAGDVRQGAFPDEAHSFHMPADEAAQLDAALRDVLPRATDGK